MSNLLNFFRPEREVLIDNGNERLIRRSRNFMVSYPDDTLLHVDNWGKTFTKSSTQSFPMFLYGLLYESNLQYELNPSVICLDMRADLKHGFEGGKVNIQLDSSVRSKNPLIFINNELQYFIIATESNIWVVFYEDMFNEDFIPIHSFANQTLGVYRNSLVYQSENRLNWDRMKFVMKDALTKPSDFIDFDFFINNSSSFIVLPKIYYVWVTEDKNILGEQSLKCEISRCNDSRVYVSEQLKLTLHHDRGSNPNIKVINDINLNQVEGKGLKYLSAPLSNHSDFNNDVFATSLFVAMDEDLLIGSILPQILEQLKTQSKKAASQAIGKIQTKINFICDKIDGNEINITVL